MDFLGYETAAELAAAAHNLGAAFERDRIIAILKRRAEHAYVNTAAELLECIKEIEGKSNESA